MSQSVGYMTASALVFVLCDILSSMEDEVRLIWKSQWSYPKVMYVASRYIGPTMLLVMALGGSLCAPDDERKRIIISMISTFGCWAGFLAVNLIVSVRVYALYNRMRKILFLNVALWVSELCVGGYAVIRLVNHYVNLLSKLPPPGSPCYTWCGFKLSWNMVMLSIPGLAMLLQC